VNWDFANRFSVDWSSRYSKPTQSKR
jgi:hypothetical protein